MIVIKIEFPLKGVHNDSIIHIKTMKVNILGFGIMAKQIASLFYLAGYDVSIWNHQRINISLLDKQIKRDRRFLHDTGKGKVSLLSKLENIKDNLTIEAIIEDLTLKRNLYENVKNKINKPYFTNTSSYRPSEISLEVNGLHFFNPITHIKVIELCLSGNTEDVPDLKILASFLTTNGYDILKVKNNRGYIGNYLLFSEISTALRLIEQCEYTYKDLMTMYSHLYNGRDIFNIMDSVGLDTTYRIIENLGKVYGTLYLPKVLKKAVDNNILGKKNKTSIKSLLME